MVHRVLQAFLLLLVMMCLLASCIVWVTANVGAEKMPIFFVGAEKMPVGKPGWGPQGVGNAVPGWWRCLVHRWAGKSVRLWQVLRTQTKVSGGCTVARLWHWRWWRCVSVHLYAGGAILCWVVFGIPRVTES